MNILQKKIKKQIPQRNQRKEDSLPQKVPTQCCCDRSADYKGKQHPAMGEQLPDRILIPMADGMTGRNAHLTQMIGAKSGRHRDMLGLPKGVVLHGGNQIDRHLGNAVGSAFRQKA